MEGDNIDAFVENLYLLFYATTYANAPARLGGVFRIQLLGYSEDIDLERGICWR